VEEVQEDCALIHPLVDRRGFMGRDWSRRVQEARECRRGQRGGGERNGLVEHRGEFHFHLEVDHRPERFDAGFVVFRPRKGLVHLSNQESSSPSLPSSPRPRRCDRLPRPNRRSCPVGHIFSNLNQQRQFGSPHLDYDHLLPLLDDIPR
jgi:hypothetical protein